MTTDRVPTTIKVGLIYRGALMVPGDTWPTHVPVWDCAPHKHADPVEAQRCADEELRRRIGANKIADSAPIQL